MNGAEHQALIDTGSMVSIINESMLKRHFSWVPIEAIDTVYQVHAVGGKVLDYIGVVHLQVSLGKSLAGTDESLPISFLVMEDRCAFTKEQAGGDFLIVGMNAIELFWKNQHTDGNSETRPLLQFAYSAFTQVSVVEQFNDGELGRVRLAEDVVIRPNTEICTKCTFRCKTLNGITADVHLTGHNKTVKMTECLRTVPLSPYTKVMVPLYNDTEEDIVLRKGHDVGEAFLSPVPFKVNDDDREAVQLECARIDVNFLDKHTQRDKTFAKPLHYNPVDVDDDEEELSPDMRLLWEHVDTLTHLDEDERFELINVLESNDATFSKSDYDIGLVKHVKHNFVLKDDVPFRVRHRNLPPRKYAAARDHLQQLQDKGIIRPSVSPYSSAPMFLSKPDGRVRMVTDLRHLNDKTVRDCYALPKFDDILPYLSGSHYFSKMDIRSGYYNIEVEEKDKEKTAFSTPFGLYEYNRMVQGAKTSASTFQRCMENILRPMLYEGCVAFLDDVIIYSRTASEHLQLLDRALKLMRDAGLKIHPGKCTFMSTEVVYLGHVISHNGVEANPEKIRSVRDWPEIRTVKDVMKFLGFCGYFRRHIPNFSKLALPLIRLTHGVKYKPKSKFGPPVKQPALQKSVLHLWTRECDEARKALIQALISPPLLKFPDLDKTFILHVDACTTGLGAVLLQFGDDQKLHPVCYASRSLKPAEVNYPAYKLEFLALKWAVCDKFNFYLYGHPFKVYTDNNPLTYIHKTLKVDAVSLRWIQALGSYDFTIQYKPGNTNVDADILSRQFEPSEELTDVGVGSITAEALDTTDLCQCITADGWDEEALATVCALQEPFDWSKLQDDDKDLAQAKALLIADAPQTRPKEYPKRYRKLFYLKDQLFVGSDGLLYKRSTIDGVVYNLIVLPINTLPRVLQALHDESGHFGADRVINLFRRRFYMAGYAKAICDYVNSCKPCNIKKDIPSKKGKMGRVGASRPFEVLSMDYLKLEPDTAGYRNILVVTDVFTKYAFAFPTRNETALTTAKVLMEKVFSVFGIPEKLLSDNGKSFEAEVIKQLCGLLGVQKIFTCPYSPKSDAICERYNRTLIDMLGTLGEEKRRQWSKYTLHMCNLYNSSIHSSTGFSPFELMFGRKSRLPVDTLLSTDPLDSEYKSIREYVKALRTRMEFAQAIASESIELSHQANKDRYDLSAPGIVCQIGDRVLVKNVGFRGMHKLEPNWLPHEYEVIREIEGNPRVYEIRSVSNPRRKPRVLHVDMLKKVTDLADRHHKCRQYHDIEEYTHDAAKLFDDEAGSDNDHFSKVPAINTGLNQKRLDRNHRRRANYALRSLGQPEDHPADQNASDSGDSTDSSSSDEETRLYFGSGLPQHASNENVALPVTDQNSELDEQDSSVLQEDADRTLTSVESEVGTNTNLAQSSEDGSVPTSSDRRESIDSMTNGEGLEGSGAGLEQVAHEALAVRPEASPILERHATPDVIEDADPTGTEKGTRFVNGVRKSCRQPKPRKLDDFVCYVVNTLIDPPKPIGRTEHI